MSKNVYTFADKLEVLLARRHKPGPAVSPRRPVPKDQCCTEEGALSWAAQSSSEYEPQAAVRASHSGWLITRLRSL